MTIDEAINHAEEVMMDYLEKTKDRNSADPVAIQCFVCADEHRQLAEWLWQLKQIQDIVQEYHDNYIEWGTGQSSVAFHKIVKIIEEGEE